MLKQAQFSKKMDFKNSKLIPIFPNPGYIGLKKSGMKIHFYFFPWEELGLEIIIYKIKYKRIPYLMCSRSTSFKPRT